jgi:hypothetical protein
VDLRFDRGEVFGRVTMCRDRQDLERPRDGVIEGREALERSLSLGFGHELEIERSELQAGNEPAIDPEPIHVDYGRRPCGRRCGRRWPIANEAKRRSHGAATGLRAR